jgi:Fic family protein
MTGNREDIQADILGTDRGETVTLMEPMRISEDSRHRSRLTDLAVDLAAKSARLRRSLPADILAALADLVRSMNCYYSNLIEGHDTHPVEIERALKNDYSADPKQRDLQVEARAHIAVQRWIDEGNFRESALTADGVREIHRRFCAQLPDDMLWVGEPETQERLRVIPGAFRHRDVRVGRHVPVSPGAVHRFMLHFEEGYRRLGKTDAVLAAAAAHHRLLWIHPFLDGNGRVTRLMSHALLLETLDTGALWSVARGLARSDAAYRRHLAECDLPRRNDLDGRANLSEEALASFTQFFLESCIDQVTFMESLIEPDRLCARILLWAAEEARLGLVPPHAGTILEAVLLRGNFPRGEVANLLGVTPRHARRIISALVERDVLVGAGPREPLKLAFPAALAGRWMPGLFPEKAPSEG